MVKITSIKGARAYGRRLKFIPYLATATQVTTKGDQIVDRGPASTFNLNFQYSLGRIVEVYGDGTFSSWLRVTTTQYSCPLGGTYNPNTGLCQ